ncbi:MAG: hypothetical protein EA426_07880 [Spirochaetaceae bacterium]|nr:MAG: hypothetical protein EA426_07880 [Spirochaetaceae bacterium]
MNAIRLRFVMMVVAVLAGVAGAGSAREIVNAHDAVLRYVVVPTDQATHDRNIADPARIVEIIAAQTDLRYVPPAGLDVLPSQPADGAAIYGVYAYAGDIRWHVLARYVPVWTRPIRLSANDIIVRDSQPVTTAGWTVPPLATSIVIDNRYLDWEHIPYHVYFDQRARPETFVRDDGRSRTTVPIDSSLFWARAGSNLEGIKLAVNSGMVYTMVSAYSAFAEQSLVVAYAYLDRREPAVFSIELPVTRPGIVFLWWSTAEKPAAIGRFVYDRFHLEAEIELHALETVFGPIDELDPDILARLSFDFAVVVPGSGVYEEFFGGTVFARDIVGFR